MFDPKKYSQPSAANLRFSATMIRHCLFATHVSIINPGHSFYVTIKCLFTGRSATIYIKDIYLMVRLVSLSLLNLRLQWTQPISYYAFFKEWLPLSLSFDCHSPPPSWSTKIPLETLPINLGCFPLDYGPYHPKSICSIIWKHQSCFQLSCFSMPCIRSFHWSTEQINEVALPQGI